MLSTHYDLIDFKVFAHTTNTKVNQFIELLKDKEVQSVFKLLVENIIVISDFDILKRLSALEDPQTAPQLNENHVTERIPTANTRTEARACKIVERLKGKRFLDSKEIVNYLKHGIDEHLRVKEGQNVRKIKKEVLNKVIQLFPNMFLDKKKQGRREVRLIAPT